MGDASHKRPDPLPDAHPERLRRAARAAHSLSEQLWEALHEELLAPDSARILEFSRRLAELGSTIELLATASAPPPASPPEPSPLEPPEPSPEGGIEVRDARPSEQRPALHPRGEDAPAAWIGSIDRRLERHREDRLPFAVLLIEVLDIDRLAHAEPPPEIDGLIDRVERAIGERLRPADLLTRESLGRYWLVTPETDVLGARQLAERLAATVRLAASHRGVPLEVAVGIAVCPDDGREAAALAAHADVGVYAARAAGRPVAPGDSAA